MFFMSCNGDWTNEWFHWRLKYEWFFSQNARHSFEIRNKLIESKKNAFHATIFIWVETTKGNLFPFGKSTKNLWIFLLKTIKRQENIQVQEFSKHEIFIWSRFASHWRHMFQLELSFHPLISAWSNHLLNIHPDNI